MITPRARAIAPIVGLVLAGANQACDDDGSHQTSTTTRLRLVGDTAAATLTATARRVVGGHGDHESFPRSGLEMLGGPSPGALVALLETAPGVYTATLADAAAAYHYRLEGFDYLHDMPPRFTATAAMTSLDPPVAVVTWDPPLDPRIGREAVHVRVDDPTGQPATSGCGPALELVAEAADHVTIPSCALTSEGTYRITIRRTIGGTGDERNGEFLYAWADREVVREITLLLRGGSAVLR